MIVFLAVLGPVLGLIGTGLGLWIGHRRWKTESALKEQEAFQGNLRAAYFSLWDVVEDAHLKMRSALDGLTAEVFSGFLADVNNFMIKHGLYIERDDRLLVLEYLFWTNEYLRVLTQSPRGKAAVLASLVHSADQGLEFGDRVRMLEELQERAVELRNQNSRANSSGRGRTAVHRLVTRARTVQATPREAQPVDRRRVQESA